ncbi:alpha/beta hydrolase [Mycolicibacterium poriferae]|uniref:alpha/beta hydrolase n=1 Tax=Mycolicibacterium poriferae TaxID=39694 RepID=UPI0024B8F4A4|nr:alpha/beta hydrolase [Mycolicibacterium poriferae]
MIPPHAPSDDIGRRLDPALEHFAGIRTDLSPAVLGAVRDSLNQRRAEAAPTVDDVGVEIEQREIRLAAKQSVRVRIYRGAPAPSPALLYFHSGAFVLGNLDTDHRQCVEFARRGRCTVVSAEYRLAPEHPFPAAADDALAILRWAVDAAVEVGLDTAALAVGGSSAGASLAARLAQCAAAGEAPPVVFQLLHQPVLDDRPSPSKEAFTTTPGFDADAVGWMWRHYLADTPPSADAAPARVEELAGLAPALITCAELDPLRDEAVDYALRLMWAGVRTELHVFAGTCHGFDSLSPEWEVSTQLFALQGSALRRAFW